MLLESFTGKGNIAKARECDIRWSLLSPDEILHFSAPIIRRYTVVTFVVQTVSPRCEFEKERKGGNGTEGKVDWRLLIARLPAGAHKNGGKSVLDLIFDTGSEPGKEIIYMYAKREAVF